MKAPLALAFAGLVAAPAAFAHAGDMWSGTYVEVVPEVTLSTPVTGSRIAPVEYTTAPRDVVVYEDRVVRGSPIVVRESYVYSWPDDVLLRPGYPDLSGYPDRIAALNPQTGQLNDYGLFNRRGPNDFGR